ncbi:MAG TPA: signal peptidase I [Candidatus Pullilachnospira intestinigallinarum]|nr:signal peptidase I [Candidatus Pullilachnospira intestinigallinarum]
MGKKAAETAKRMVLVLMTLLALALAGPLLLGLRPRIVVSGSMEPAVPVGSLAYIKPSRDAGAVREGDIIVYQAGETMTVLHRVVRTDEKESSFVTKGDANSTEDPGTISFDRYRGTMVFAIPLAGYLAAALQRYRMTAIGILALFWTVSVIRHLAGKRKQVMTGENM